MKRILLVATIAAACALGGAGQALAATAPAPHPAHAMIAEWGDDDGGWTEGVGDGVGGGDQNWCDDSWSGHLGPALVFTA